MRSCRNSVVRLLTLLLGVGLFISAASAQNTPRPKRKGRSLAVTINSSPPGAMIYLDDKQYGLVGYTPFSTKLTKGDYKLILELQGFKAFESPITVSKRGQTILFALEKEVLPASVDVVAPSTDDSAVGAMIVVDGQQQGSIPGSFKVPEGRHQVQITKTGYDAYMEWVDVKQGEHRTMSITLKKTVVAKAKGSIVVTTDVDGAEVWVDNEKKDTAPTVVTDLDEGPHMVEVRKEGTPGWKQMVTVVANQQVKVSATIKAQMPQFGSIKVLSNANGAEVYLDGELKGNVPAAIANVAPGTHILEVKADGFDPSEENVDVVVGQEKVLKVTLKEKAKPTTGWLQVLTAPDSNLFVDGKPIPPPIPDKIELSPGKHVVLVQKPGFADFRQDAMITAGETLNVDASKLSDTGHITFLSEPPGAQVFVDGELIGQTKVEKDLKAGKHQIVMKREAYNDWLADYTVTGGKDEMVTGNMVVAMTGPTDEELLQQQRKLTSFGARVIPQGKFTADLSAGYPYVFEGRLSVGAFDTKQLGLDASIETRFLFAQTYEIDGGARVRLFEKNPFALAAFGSVGGGDGRNGRNTFFMNAGGIFSLTFQDKVTFSARGYFNIYSDRLCPDKMASGEARGCHLDQTAQEWKDIKDVTGIKDSVAGAANTSRSRDNGLRFMASAILEISYSTKQAFFLIFEGPPFQKQRASFKDAFNSPMTINDVETYLRAGVTFKF
jgi:hypothetical protein